jgi:hypothetical protein
MKLFFILKRVLFWSYDRGTWQYDLMCVVILSFIFLVPASVFDDPEARSRRVGLGPANIIEVPADAIGSALLANGIQTPNGDREIERIEAVRDRSGQIRGYRVWSRSRTRAGE